MDPEYVHDTTLFSNIATDLVAKLNVFNESMKTLLSSVLELVGENQSDVY